MRLSKVAVAVLLALLILGAFIVPMGAAQASSTDTQTQVGPFEVPIPGTGCKVVTPWVFFTTSPVTFALGPAKIVCT